jgi:succinyl-CoA synthetase beta subunit
MKLFEFEAKNILKEYGLAVPEGRLAASPSDAAAIAAQIDRPVVVKAQVLVSGRGKAGGIMFATGADAVSAAASRLIGQSIKGSRVERVLVEEQLEIDRELYVSVAIDAAAKSYVALASTVGGVDIESAARTHPGSVARRWFNPVTGFDTGEATDMARQLGLSGEEAATLARIISILCRIAIEQDAELVETNPLAITRSGCFVAADARITMDDNSLFRHPEFQSRSSARVEDSPLEAEARRENITYVELSGSVGIIGNGAGLVMATLDMVELFGGKPANFLDIGGGARPDIVKKSLLLVMSKPEVRSVLINILGGITRCDLVAEGVVAGLLEAPTRKPVAVRMIGTNEEAGTRLLNAAGVHVYSNMEDAVRMLLQSQPDDRPGAAQGSPG